MTEVELTRLLRFARCIPREALDVSEEIFRIERSPEDVLGRLYSHGEKQPSFVKIADELRKNPENAADGILIVRTAILTRARYAVHSPKAVCTLPGSNRLGMEDTLTESVRLIQSAEFSISLMNYWVTSGSELLVRTLMEKARANPSVRIVIVGDSKEKFLVPFNKMWSAKVPKPTIFIYKPGMGPDSDERSKMHAKTLLIDECRMLITSANMTRAAVTGNIEVGISIEAPKAVRKVAEMINQLIHRPDLFERIT